MKNKVNATHSVLYARTVSNITDVEPDPIVAQSPSQIILFYLVAAEDPNLTNVTF